MVGNDTIQEKKIVRVTTYRWNEVNSCSFGGSDNRWVCEWRPGKNGRLMKFLNDDGTWGAGHFFNTRKELREALHLSNCRDKHNHYYGGMHR